MQKISTLLFSLCLTISTFAINWGELPWLGNGSGLPEYNDAVKVYIPAEYTNVGVVNLQAPGFATEPGIYVTFPAGILDCSLGEGHCDIQGAGIILHLSAFTAKETAVTVNYAGGSATIYVYWKDGTGEASGNEDPVTPPGGDPTDPITPPGGDPVDPTPGTIDWSSIPFLGDGAQGGALSNMYKVATADGQTVVNIQNSAEGVPAIYTYFPAAPLSDYTLGDDAWEVAGAGCWIYLNAFSERETVVSVTAGSVAYQFVVYFAGGTTTGLESVAAQTATKRFGGIDGRQLLIVRDGVTYTVSGQIVK